MTEFGRDHFSFSTKVNVGEFYENRSGGENVSTVSFFLLHFSLFIRLDDCLIRRKHM